MLRYKQTASLRPQDCVATGIIVKNTRPDLKPLLVRAVKYGQLIIILAAVAAVGLWMGEKGLNQKYQLEEKRFLLQKENERLASDIKALERTVTLLRSDPKTIEKVAKRKLGMVRSDETVYIFRKADPPAPPAASVESGLGNPGKRP